MAGEIKTIEEVIEETSAKSLFNKLDGSRSAIMTNNENYAKLTIPSLFFDEESVTQDDVFDTPFQSFGARAVNSLASKLLSSQLPANSPFFKLIPKEEDLANMSAEELVVVEKQLNLIENSLSKEVERQALRIPSFQAFKLLIVTGNALLYKIPKGTFKVYNLNNYVVERDFEGNIIELILKEQVNYRVLPDDIKSQIEETEDSITIYTRITRYDSENYYVYQEIEEIVIETTKGSHSTTDFPYMALRWNTQDGENYGRGLVEQFSGDLRTLEALSQIIIEGAAVSSKIIYMIRPGSTIRVKDMSEVNNGGIIQGDANDVTTLQTNKIGDLQYAMQLSSQIEQRLGQAFLLSSSAVRDSERTTATEIRYLSSELEETLGGVYSLLSLEFQKPLINILINESDFNIENLVEPIIVTGIEALSREKDLQKLQFFTQTLAGFGPDIINQYMNMGVYIDKLASSLGLDTKGLVKGQEQISQEQQAAYEQQLAQQAGSNIVEGATNPDVQIKQNELEQKQNQ